ncbi:MAG: DUF4102 domain-containing protein [Proteobacteria bacterium]|nr:DUF4102 domain-containing protein [Pseudomonadota bacterium]
MLTDVSIRNLKPKKARFEIWDEKLPSFGVRVNPTGTKTFVLLYRLNRHLKRYTIGRYPILTVREARLEAQRILRDVAH